MADSRVANLSVDSTQESRVVNSDGPDSPLFTYALGLIHDSVAHAAGDQRRRDAAYAELLALLDDVRAFLDNYIDVNDGDDGQPRPNAAMQLDAEIQRVLAKARGERWPA